jgi:hypothetical protein
MPIEGYGEGELVLLSDTDRDTEILPNKQTNCGAVYKVEPNIEISRPKTLKKRKQ